MPWKETHAVSERHHLVDLVAHNGIAISQATRSLGISRKTAHKWLARYDKRGRDALTDQSRARHTQSHLHPALAGADFSNALHGLPHLQWTSNHTNQLAGQLCTPNLGKFSLRTPLLRANRKAAARRSARKVVPTLGRAGVTLRDIRTQQMTNLKYCQLFKPRSSHVPARWIAIDHFPCRRSVLGAMRTP